jgi:hypothetical protein
MKTIGNIINASLFTLVIMGLLYESHGDSKLLKLLMFSIVGFMIMRHSENVLLKSISIIANTGSKSSNLFKSLLSRWKIN